MTNSRRGRAVTSPFLTWIATNPLKSPDSDEGIQENPSPFSWSGLDRFGSAWRNLARGVTASAVRSWRAPRREWTKPVAGDAVKSALGVTVARKWRRKGLKRRIPRREMVWPRSFRPQDSAPGRAAGRMRLRVARTERKRAKIAVFGAQAFEIALAPPERAPPETARSSAAPRASRVACRRGQGRRS